MTVYCVSYDLNKQGQNYHALYEELKKLPWAHPLDSTWLIATSESAQQLSDRLRKHLDNNDFILVIEVTNYAGWLNKDIWDWIRNNI
ncbi:MAG: hypothetical protein DU481_15165 [Nitrosomonas sp.]|uniref:hypothetical protein n=1 Tax=Nitrosomonas sp. TaxID=42353 RepID=UPI0032EC353A